MRGKDKNELSTSDGTRAMGQNLNFGPTRHRLKIEDPLESASNLNQFETLVRSGKIKLHKSPPEANHVPVGGFVHISKNQGAYRARVDNPGEVNQQVTIDTERKMQLSKGNSQVIFRGSADTIIYRKPGNKQNKVASSDLLEFTILKQRRKTIAVLS